MNKFEVVLILNPELSTNTLDDEISKFKSSLESHSAKIINEENWGLRDLSYSINKFTSTSFEESFYSFGNILVLAHR